MLTPDENQQENAARDGGSPPSQKTGEYGRRGDYHRDISPDWSYYPLYLSKKKFVLDFISVFPRETSIVDVGCGEGVFVEELAKRGYTRVLGVDDNYSSDIVVRGSVLALPIEDERYDVAFFLDVIEHIPIERQADAIRELLRVLKPGGFLVISIPNLAHLASRVRFLLKGKFVRTASVEKHPGDRPIAEYMKMLEEGGFLLAERKGFFPTVPVLYKVVQRKPSRYLWLYDLLNRLLPNANWCFLNILVCRKGGGWAE
jgi:2-polyprenyl-3-methyl-5-hydroxy-6-metoxy-1,4-benzoquinol methylase